MRTVLFLFLILPFCGMAQVFDDFSDGDFTANPTWVGTDTCFKVNSSFQLQSSATTAGEAWLSTPITNKKVESLRHLVVSPEGRYAVPQGLYPFRAQGLYPFPKCAVEWRFWIRENFSPSPNNYADVWLCADTAALPNASRGYFLRFGAAGNQDAIELYRTDGAGMTLICQGAAANIASAFKVAVKVNRSAEGLWTLATDYDDTGHYTVEAEGFDDTYPVEGHFGFHLHFTSSNVNKFYFDDIYIGPEIIDTVPPELHGLDVQDPRHLLLTFSEPLDASALDTQHYRVPNNDVPNAVSFVNTPSQVLLSFNQPLPENTNLMLHIEGVTDVAGNPMPPTEYPFAVYQPAENDVVINEIMADPSPVVGLPEWEYVELFNTTALTIDLKDWTLYIGNTSKTLPSIRMEPLGYLILCKTDAEQALSAFGPTCGFSSFSIANTGATIRLFSADTTLMSEVSFNDTWYHDAEKRNGGWSLEQIDPFNPCAGTANWSASTDASGGTPGRENAINAPNVTTPSVARVSMLGDRMVLLRFDQQMDRSTLQNTAQYWVAELNLNPVEVICNPVESASLELVFDAPFEEGVVYTLVLNGMESCSGHPVEPDTKVLFGIPNAISEGDILINEILFDPIEPCVDYVELYNRSDKTFDLSALKLGVIKERFPVPADTVLKVITDDSRLFLPNSYLLLSTDGYTVLKQYGCEQGDYVDMASFPSYANAGGIAILMSRQGVTVDQMTFDASMHNPLLKETKGVALERVSWEAPSSQPDNWQSAAEAVHFGTPGYGNSMMVDDGELPESSPIIVNPEVFSPDGDGFDDNCQIVYQLERAGCTMNAYVFSADGQLVRHLVKGELVTNEGCFVWNGLDKRGLRVPTGIYIVFTEVFDMEGNVKRYKNAVAVASR